MVRKVSWIAVVGSALALGACGGGGGSDSGDFTIGGSVSGYSGSGLVLQNRGSSLPISGNGSFQFPDKVASGATYSVSVSSQPALQICMVSNGSGTATANVTNVVVSCSDVSASSDTDGDGLTDLDELNVYFTAPDLPDTDGDGFSDKDEVDRRTSTNNFQFNPLIADLPELKVEIRTIPIITLDYVDTNGTSRTSTTERSASTSSTTTTEFGASATVGVEATAEASWSLLDGPQAKASVTAYAESTVSFNHSSSQENQTAWSNASAVGIDYTRTENGGDVTVGVTLSNPSNVDFNLVTVDLAAKLATRAGNSGQTYLPIGALSYDGNTLNTTMESGKTIPDLTFRSDNLPLSTVRQMLTQSRSLTVWPAIENIKAIGTTYDYRYRTLDARIVIDYGSGHATEQFWVAAQNIPGSTSHSLQHILGNMLKIGYTEGNGIQSIRGIGANTATSRWVIMQRRLVDNEEVVTYHDPAEATYQTSSVQVEAGDTLLIVYLDDADGDHLGIREERLYGTDPNNADTDGDGLDDYTELYDPVTVIADNQQDADRYRGENARVHSSPLFADTDGDLLPDNEEKALHLDPTSRDTDGDGESDLTDRNNTFRPVYFNDAVTLQLATRAEADLSDRSFTVGGTVTASSAGLVVSEVRVSWGDGSPDYVLNSGSTTNPVLNIPKKTHLYPPGGPYTVTLTMRDNASPTPHVTTKYAEVTVGELMHPVADLGWSNSWRTYRHLREVVDLDNDGYDDVIGIGGSTTYVAKGSPSGLQDRVSWGSGWARTNVARNPRFFTDLNGDGFKDIIGVNANTNGTATVLYALNNGGTGFGDPQPFIAGTIAWNPVQDYALLADIDGNGKQDFVHMRRFSSTAFTTYDGQINYYLVLNNNVEVSPVNVINTNVLTDRRYYPVVATDLNGDHCDDLVIFGQSSTTYLTPYDCNGQDLPNGPRAFHTGFDYEAQWRVEAHKRWFEDMDADGKPDLVGIANANVLVLKNISDSSGVKFGPSEVWTSDFTPDVGWREHFLTTSPVYAHIYPRYLADVNGDGYPDLVGYGGSGAVVAYNRLGLNPQLGLDPVRGFADARMIGAGFHPGTQAAPNSNWSSLVSGAAECPIDNNVSYANCREYFPRMVGLHRNTITGQVLDAYLIGFDRAGIVEQRVPQVTPFREP